ncbi:MAG: sugar phosphate isomerase/epimerase [Armatimonadota bacterium]|nr:sugar phosphate isomerase/epimerase [Armatimonadota bacterium]MDR5698040.1 sugar phosphate isomerase/epimerase [Armatimonadota bacterium]
MRTDGSGRVESHMSASTPRLGLNGATTGQTDLLTDVKIAAEAGYDALELRDAKIEVYLRGGHTLSDLRTRLQDAGIEPLSINALDRSTLVAGAAWEAAARRCATLCDWAAALDCPYVVVVPSPLPDGLRREDAVGPTVEALRQMGEIALRRGVRIGFEFLGFGDCSVRTLSEAAAIVDDCDRRTVGLVIDAFHFHVGGSSWHALDALDPARLFVVHLDDAEDRPLGDLRDAHRRLPGDGVLPLGAFVRGLQHIGYRGVYSLELFPADDALGYQDPLALARVGRERMAALFEDRG